MNKSELIDLVANKMGMPRKRAEAVVNVIFGAMADTLSDGGRIEIRGFGSFVSRFYEEYRGRNPRTGDPIYVAPKRLPFFKVGKELRDLVNVEGD
jgi:integration host factor subunit beta